MRKNLAIFLIFSVVIISVYFLIFKTLKNNQIKKPALDYQTNNSNNNLRTTNASNGSILYTIPQLGFTFELPSKLASCGTFTVGLEPSPYSGRTIRSKFSDFACTNNFFLNAYSVTDKSGMRNFDIFMNIQGYILKNNTYSYLRYYDDVIKETPISIVSNPYEIQSTYGVRMLKVKGVGQISNKQLPLIGGLTEGEEGTIIITNNSTYPALTLTVVLDKMHLTEDEINNILLSFKKL